VLLAKLASLALAATVLGSHPAPKRYYLALGDSIAYGIQPGKVNAGLQPSGFHTGYVDVFAARLRKLAPGLRVVNYGCPGETTRTMVAGGCPWLAERRKLHDTFRGAQLAAALSFLRTHRGQVSPITVTLGGNDIGEIADACKGKFACIKSRAPRELERFSSRLSAILRPLRAAAPNAEIVLTGIWNFNVDDLKRTDPLFRQLNAAIARVAARSHAHVADTFSAFNPQGSLARERAQVCAFTFVCSDDDPHPTDAGYRAIAAAVWKAAGY
jgi:lysophospholipase L1-like esterase